MFTQHRRTWTQTVIRAVQAHGRKALAALTALATVAALVLVAAPAHAEETRIADPTTFTQWEQGMGDPTDPRSTGRVWTDKSVATEPVTLETYDHKEVTVTPQDDSFLVGLSAMSSAQKLVGVSNVTKPLDIVLVLDTSGSMDENMTTYSPVYANQLDKGESYYIPNGNSYREVTWSNRANSWGYGWVLNWTSVTPKTAADDTAADHVQFYAQSTASRMDALKQAVNGFIDQTIASNAKVSDTNKKNRIGLVTYASNASRKSGLVDSLGGLKTIVDGLSANGGTQAGKGMTEANTVLGQARADASKTVIFFTDGQPGDYGFDGTVANDAISQAGIMKANGASVYSVGIFEGADPAADVSKVTSDSDATLKSNAFMQGVSSNYPDATAYTQLGTKAADANYYLAASDADALNTVFDTIWGEVSSNPDSPIQTESQGGTTAGNGVVTFTDQLGDYMRVTRMNSIVFAGQQYETVSSQTSADGSQTTYTFEGKVEANEIYKEADLSTMQIVVTHNEGKTGDLVTVNVPAELLPLRLYTANVDKDGNVTTSINRTNPMRLFYEVNLKDGTEAKIAQPDEQMRQYLADPANIDADGSVRFLTNAYSKAANGDFGSTTAVFTPATTNDFYYFTQDTPLYNSESTDDPATRIEAGKTYYYQRTYYANNAKHEQWIEVLGANAEGKAVADADGHYYAPAGTVRTGLSRRYTAAKESNPTGTAANSIAPHWEMNTVTVNLGNNGLRKVARPGTLEVTETVEWTDGEMPEAVKAKAFPFTLALSGVGADGEYQAMIAGQNTTVKNGTQFSLKHGESVMVYGLPAGATAIVTQTDTGGKGWSVNHKAAEGSITAGETTKFGFVNRYAPDPVTLPEGSISGAKTLMKRDWQPDESFTFQIAAGDSNPEAPMPEQSAVTVTNPGGADAYQNGQRIPFAFGAITYTKPGTYQYVITEQGGGKPGMQYSGARYIATVTVTDNGDGTMSAAAVLTNTFGDDGVHIDGEPEAASADFTNTFVGENESVATIRGIKHYTDHTGSKPNNVVGTFNVMITPDEGNPANGPTFKSDVPVGVDGTWTRKLQFTNEALNGQHEQTFTYHVREIVPEGVGSGNPTKDGMTYDVNTYDVQITVSRDEQHNLITTVTYPDGGERVELTNSYRAADTDPQDLAVTKTVTGRDAEAGKFTFNATLSAGDAKNVKVKQADGSLADWADHAVKTPKIAKDGSADIDFGQLVFTMPDTYTFQVSEQLPEGVTAENLKKDGWTYDAHTHTVTYTVTDDNGKLKAVSATDGSKTFTNAYTASTQYQGMMQIGKTLTGRSMNPGEFGFIIEPKDGAPMPGNAAQATTANPFSAVSGQELVWPINTTLLAGLRFTQDDAGKTYEYTIREQMPEGVAADNPEKNGVTYDFTEHTASIEVIDNGDGTLSTQTWIDDDTANTVARFKNTYKVHTPAVSEIGFAKTISGRDWQEGESFAFELTPNAGQSSVAEDVLKKAMPEQATVTVSKPGSGNTARFAFTGFQFEQAGTYVYNVREQHAGTTADGLTHDGRTAVASFTVVDNGLGEYSIGRLITGVDSVNGVNTFTNTYKADQVTVSSADLGLSKQLTGIAWPEDRAFEFTLTGKDNAPMPQGAQGGKLNVSVGKPVKGDTADITFGDITYTEAGVYEYEVRETKGDMLGVSYDAHSAKVTVTVTDNGKGRLEASVTTDDGKFVNEYSAREFTGVPAGMEFSKQLTGIAWPEDRAFEFTLEAKTANAPMPADTTDGKLTKTVGKPTTGDTTIFNFGSIRYDKPGTYEYTVKETKGDMPGVSYDGHSATVTVTVRDNGRGQLEATAVVTDGAFVNAYGAQPSGGVPEGMTFIKQLTGIDWPADRSFEFTLTGEGNAPMPQGAKDGKLNVTVGKPADGNAAAFDFGAITYTTEGKYKYTVTEVAGDMPGVAYAKNTAKVTVTVKDDKQGKLIATAAVEGNVFANEYSAKEFTGVPTGMAFSKELTGIEWPEGRAFEFTLEAVTKDAPMPAEAKVSVGKPDKGAKADFGFGDITFTKAGTYEYTVKEAKGDMPGVSYDAHSAKVTVTVTDNGKGQLEAKAIVSEGAFTNTYTAQQVTVGSADLGLSKQLTGIEWPADRSFEFTLAAEGDAPMPQGAKDGKLNITVGKPADGDTADIMFGDITYTKVGVYTYTVKEAKGDMPGVSYDTHTAKVTVTVRDNGKGQLEASVKIDGGQFTNAYSAKEFTGVPSGMAFSKELTGTAWPDNGVFTFTLTGKDGAPMPQGAQAGVFTQTVNKPAQGDKADFTFGDITYTKTGTYTYTVKELAGIMPGVAFDDHEATVTVTVTDNGNGQLEAKAVVDKADFVNTYTAKEFHGVPEGMAFSKELTGTEWTEGREFTFMIEAVDGAPAPEQPTVTVGKPGNGNTADFTFGALTFTKTGTYQYVVTERNDGQPGITYDDHKAHVTVTVTDNGLGHLVATAKVDGAKFTNAYSAKPFEGVPTGMAFSKQLTGVDWPEDRAFEFTLEGKDGAPMPAEAKAMVAKPAKGGAASFGFGAIRYEEPGVYEYTVKETKGDMPGVSYDGHSATVTVTVRDNGQGQLEATAVVTDAAFVNTYDTTPSDGVPEGMTFIKQLDGIEWPAGRAFEFTLEGVDGAPMPAKSTLQVAKPADSNAAVFDFGAITYTAEGEYRYKVRETKGDMPGVSYDTHVADVTVTVTDNKQGDLVATATVVGNVFVNEYEAKEFTGVPTGMAFSKELTGIAWPADREFEFTLEGKDESTPMPAETKATVGKPEQGAKADFMFGDITYTQPGVYEYTVKEAKGDMPGVAYDTHTAKVTVKVTDNGKGQLEAKATVDGAKFTNSYNAKPFEGVPAGLEFSKQLTGIAWPADRTFEFTLEAATDGAPMPAEAKATVGKPAEGDTASFGFGAIRYEEPGMYEYTVKETRGTMPGVAYDYHTARITVTVTDNGQGQLDATAKVTEGKFVNTYSAVPATGVPTDFTLTKRVEGMEWNADQKFEFTIQAQGGAPMPKNATTTVGKPANGDSANFDFGEIVFDRAGVYRYTVTETAGTQPGMVYDGHTATVTVDVADDGQGHLVTATTVENGLFTNTYSTQAVAYPGVDVTEDLTGRAQAQGEFQFVVSGSASDMARAGYTIRAITSTPYEFAAAASGETVTVPGLFTGLELTHSDVRAGKRFVYEVDQTGAQSGNGLTVDDQVYRVEIWATDNGDGTMRVHTSINGVESIEPTPVLPFHNVYATAPVTIGGDAQVRINARKTLHGRALADGEFRFVVRDAKGAQLAGGTNAASGAVNFDAIEFTDARLISDVQAGIATAHVDGTQTVYRYEVTVSELTDALPAGITALESGFAATLVITDNGQGKLEAAVEYPADADGTLGFVNQYGAASEVSLGLNGNKVLAVAGGNNAPDITGKYTFTLSGSQGAPMPQKTTAVNDAAGAVDFGQITYTMANVFGEQEAKPEEPKADENADGSDDASDVEADDVTTREKTFTYTVTESGSVAGVANDASAQRTITVHVKDNGDGTLTVSKESAATGTDFTFTNTYGVRPTDPVSPTDTSIKGGVPLTKTLNGRDLKAGEFTFELIEAASGKVVGSAANADDGSVSLPGVVFEAPGSYAYLVRELAGTTGGVTYDSRVYAAVATVVDNGDGTLGVSWAVTEPAVGPVEVMVFENTYAAQPTSVQISAGKMLLGRDLAAGEFQFALTALDSAPMPEGAADGVQTVANDEHGNAQFGVIDYAQAGEYHYTVSEVKGDAEGVTYDETEHAVVVRVTDDGEGQLLATVDYGDGEQGVVFTNTYTKPEEPDTPDTPDTPDQPKPNAPAPSTPAAPQYPASGTPTYRPYSYSTSSRPYTGTVAYTGSDVALIVAVAAVLLAAGAALLTMARRRQ